MYECGGLHIRAVPVMSCKIRTFTGFYRKTIHSLPGETGKISSGKPTAVQEFDSLCPTFQFSKKYIQYKFVMEKSYNH